jgi:hypothetical protein
MDAGEQDFTTYQPSLTYPHTPAQHVPEPTVTMPEGALSTGHVAKEPGSSDNDAI